MKKFIDHLNAQNLSFDSSVQWIDHEFCPNIWKNFSSLTSVGNEEKLEMFKTLVKFCSSARKCGYEFMENETGGESIGVAYNDGIRPDLPVCKEVAFTLDKTE